MLANVLQTSLLSGPDQHPLFSPATVRTLGSVLVAAPHPDDESLGCGGLLALCAQSGIPTHVVVMTDGSRSHPHSLSYPAARLAAVREDETRAALAELGLPAAWVTFLRHPDGALPLVDTPFFKKTAARLHAMLLALAPATLFVPWRRDPHCDHEATWQLFRQAIQSLPQPPRWLEYPIWAWPHAESGIAPQAGEVRAWRLDITPVLARKEKAIARHRSQTGTLIHDDPSGFTLEPAMLAYFAQPWELFLET